MSGSTTEQKMMVKAAAFAGSLISTAACFIAAERLPADDTSGLLPIYIIGTVAALMSALGSAIDLCCPGNAPRAATVVAPNTAAAPIMSADHTQYVEMPNA